MKHELIAILNILLGSFAGMTFGFREFLSQHNITLAGTPLEVEELMFRKVRNLFHLRHSSWKFKKLQMAM
jgi:hypothetical protein